MRGWTAPGAVALAVTVTAGLLAASCSEETPAIDRALIAGNLFSNQVRQGVGPLSIEITGRGLQWVESAWLEDLPVTVRQGVTGADGGVTVDLVVPHGTMPGARSLTLTLKDNRPILTQDRAVEVTTIRATAQGDDAVGLGTPEHPFRSLTKALGLSAGGDQVELGAGTYTLVSGERWPSESGSPPSPPVNNVPDGVVLVGAGSAVTALDGTGLLASAAPLIFGGGAGVQGMTLRNFHRGLVVGRGLVNATDVAVASCTAEGAIAYGSAVLRLTSVAISGCSAGVRALDSAYLEITDSNFDGNGVGVAFDGSSRGLVSSSGCHGNAGAGVAISARGTDITLDGVTADQNGQGAAPASSGIYVTGTPRLTLRSGTLSSNRGSGLYASGTGSFSLSVMNATLNGLDGYTFDGVTSAMVDKSQALQNSADGLQVTATGDPQVDVSASTLRGNNQAGATVRAGTTSIRSSTIDGNGTHGVRVLNAAALSLPWDPLLDAQADVISAKLVTNACLSDERAQSAGSTISVVHALLQGAVVPAGLVQGPVDRTPQYRIVSSNNQINFLP